MFFSVAENHYRDCDNEDEYECDDNSLSFSEQEQNRINEYLNPPKYVGGHFPEVNCCT